MRLVCYRTRTCMIVSKLHGLRWRAPSHLAESLLPSIIAGITYVHMKVQLPSSDHCHCHSLSLSPCCHRTLTGQNQEQRVSSPGVRIKAEKNARKRINDQSSVHLLVYASLSPGSLHIIPEAWPLIRSAASLFVSAVNRVNEARSLTAERVTERVR